MSNPHDPRLSALLTCAVAAMGCAPTVEKPADSVIWPNEAWPVSTPAEQGIEPSAVDSLVADLAAGEYGLVDAFMLVRNGYVVANHRFSHNYDSIAASFDTINYQYNYDHPDWHPYLRDTELHTLQSATKSVTSAALGIAVDEGLIDGVDALAMPYFEAYEPYPSSPRREATAVEDLLTMRSGIRWNTSASYGTGENSTDLLESSDDWIRFVLDQPTDTTPGEHFQYNDGASVLLGKILREATGQRIDEWARTRLFEPIGIKDFYWKITPDGEADTEGGLYLSTEDLARFGYLFLRGGEWNGRQVLSRAWVEASTSPVVTDVAPNNEREDPGYGYYWWIPIQQDGQAHVFAASGYGGQSLLVVPEYDIVLVFNGWHIHGRPDRSTRTAFQERILPYIDGGEHISP